MERLEIFTALNMPSLEEKFLIKRRIAGITVKECMFPVNIDRHLQIVTCAH